MAPMTGPHVSAVLMPERFRAELAPTAARPALASRSPDGHFSERGHYIIRLLHPEAHMTRLILPLLPLALLAGCQTLPVEPNLTEVEALERARFQAWVKADTAAMQPMLADDLLYCHSSGLCETKEQIVASIASRRTVYRKMDIVSLKPRAVGGAVLINGKADVTVDQDGKPLQFQMVYTDVYVKRDGRWQLVSWQSTRLP